MRGKVSKSHVLFRNFNTLGSRQSIIERTVPADIQEHVVVFLSNSYFSHHNPIRMMCDVPNDLLLWTEHFHQTFDDRMHSLQQICIHKFSFGKNKVHVYHKLASLNIQ
jgi:hypothetical protein